MNNSNNSNMNVAYDDELPAEEAERLDKEIAQYESGDLVADMPDAVPDASASSSSSASALPMLSKAVDELYLYSKQGHLARKSFDARALATAHPPRLQSKNKQIVYRIACPNGPDSLNGTVTVSRWHGLKLPMAFAAPYTRDHSQELKSGDGCLLQHREDLFTYSPPVASPGYDKPPIEWHVNFADRHLFGYYGGSLFAQDEMQVTEHPVLASLREALVEMKDDKLQPLTMDVTGETPVLVMGAERRVAVATDKNKEMGRPGGLYGNMFSMASEHTVTRATTAIIPPTVSNIVAMEAPKYGHGTYSMGEITQILRTAYTAFVAARVESYVSTKAMTDDPSKRSPDAVFPRVVIHTGNWGTGAYGGNKTIMALLQMAAARLALGDNDALIYHTVSAEYTAAYHEAERHLRNFLAPQVSPITISGFINKVFALKLRWGQSDGN